MLTKYTYQLLQPVAYGAQNNLFTTAGVRRVVPLNTNDFRYLRFRAIGCMEKDGPNGNWDGFPYEHFEDERPNYGYKSFIDKRAHVEHNCFVAGTPILMANFGYCPIEDVQEGDKVWCHDGNTGIVKQVFVNYTYSGVFNIKAEGVLDALSLTEGHPLEVISRIAYNKAESQRRVKRNALRLCGEKLSYDDGVGIIVNNLPMSTWIRAEDVNVGDFLVIPHINVERNETSELVSMARIFGLYIAEGSTTGNKNILGERLHQRIEFSFHKEEQALIQAVHDFGCSVNKTVTERFSTSKEKVEKYGEPNCVIATLFSSELGNLFVKHGGRLARYKKLSQEVMTMPVEWQKEFLAAYFEGDSNINADTGIKGSTASRELALQLQRMLLSLGVWCNIAHYTQNTPNDSWVKNSYGNSIYVYSIKPSEVVKLFGNRFPMSVSNKVTSTWLKTDSAFLVPVKSVERQDYVGKVYNFEVTHQNSYIAYNVSCHNSSEGIAGSIGDLPDAFLNRFVIPKELGGIRYSNLLAPQMNDQRQAVLNLPNQKDGSIEVLMRIDAKLAGDTRGMDFKSRHTAERILRMIDTGQRLACSMGTNIEYSVCSSCGNIAHFANEYCDHIASRKGAISMVSANQLRDLMDAGHLRPEWLPHLMIIKREQNDVLHGYSSRAVAVRNSEVNHVLSFFELSIVGSPAFTRALELEKFARQQSIWQPTKSSVWQPLAKIEWDKLTDNDMLRFTNEAQARGLISTACALA